MITDVLSSRTMGAYPISIGTSLAVESIATGPNPPYDPERVVPEKIELSYYDAFWINLHTLVRAIIGAVPTVEADKLKALDIATVMQSEIQVIRDLVAAESHGKTSLLLYVSQYKDLDKKHPMGKIRSPKTEKQIAYHKLVTDTLNLFNSKQVKGSVEVFSRELNPKEKKKVLIHTHYAYDLLSHGKFAELHLLESHTGVLKKKAQWYTKYSGGKDLVRIPFKCVFLQVFGDSQTFYGDFTKIKKDVIALADQFQWTSTTTDERLRLSFNSLRDTSLAMMLDKLLSEDHSF